MSSTLTASRRTTPPPTARRAEPEPGSEEGERPEDDHPHSLIEEIAELPHEVAAAAGHITEEIEELPREVAEAAHRLLTRKHRRDLQTTDLVNEVALRFETNNALKSLTWNDGGETGVLKFLFVKSQKRESGLLKQPHD